MDKIWKIIGEENDLFKKSIDLLKQYGKSLTEQEPIFVTNLDMSIEDDLSTTIDFEVGYMQPLSSERFFKLFSIRVYPECIKFISIVKSYNEMKTDTIVLYDIESLEKHMDIFITLKSTADSLSNILRAEKMRL